MFSLRRPTDQQIREFLARQQQAGFSYPEVGASDGELPAGYAINHHRTRLGYGSECFAAAQAAIRDWAMYPAMVELHEPAAPVQQGTVVAPLARLLGVWGLGACKIVYVIDEPAASGGIARFGFAYGTLETHPMQGEERFLVEYDPADDSVSYDLLAFSRPRRVLAKLAIAWIRAMQKRFGRESLEAMRRAVTRQVHVRT